MFGSDHALRLIWKAAAIGAVLGLVACLSAPVSGRNQLILFSKDREVALGVDAYRQIIEKNISNDSYLTGRMNEVGRRIAAASDQPGLV